MALKKANRTWNYKTYDLSGCDPADFLDNLGKILDGAGKSGWELAYMNEKFMVMKQLFFDDSEK